MKIYRRGTSSNRGTAEVSIEGYSINLLPDKKVIQLTKRGVRDFNSESEHNYTIDIPLLEFRFILGFLGGHLLEKNSNLISQEFSPILKEIMRIEKACVEYID